MNKKDIHQKLLRTALVPDGTNMTRWSVMLAVVMIAMFAMPMEAQADGFSWDAGTKTLTVTFPAGLSTYYDDQSLALDDETNGDKLTFYTVSAVGESSVTLTEIDTKKIPALTPVIVKNTGDGEIETDMTVDNTIAVVGYDSQFKGTVTGVTIPASGNGVNYYGFNGTDFIWIRDGGDVAPHRCWLMVGEDSGGMVIGGGARRLSIEWPAGTTGIRSMEHEESRIESRAGAWYDLRGQRLIGRPARKGVYVHQGKKVVIK